MARAIPTSVREHIPSAVLPIPRGTHCPPPLSTPPDGNHRDWLLQIVRQWAPQLAHEIRRGRKAVFCSMLAEFARVVATQTRLPKRDARIKELELFAEFGRVVATETWRQSKRHARIKELEHELQRLRHIS